MVSPNFRPTGPTLIDLDDLLFFAFFKQSYVFMSKTIQPSGVKAVDPGLGFTLTFSAPPLNQTVRVVVTLTGPGGNKYQSTVSIDTSVTDNSIQIVAPFGDANYAPGTTLQYTIDVYIPGNSNKPDASYSGAVFAASGNFQIASGLPKMASQLTNNQMINSVDDNYIGIMQGDGNFCVYEKSTLNAQQVNCTDSSNSAGAIANYVIKFVPYGNNKTRVQIQNADNNNLVASTQDLPFIAMMLVINAAGQICVGYGAGPNQYFPIQFTPN